MGDLPHIDNLALAGLPSNVLSAVELSLIEEELPIRKILFSPDEEIEWVYFPQAGMISILHVPDETGKGIEIATVGREGVVGAMAGFGLHFSLTEAVVQLP